MTRFATVSLLVVLFLAGCGSSKKVVNLPKINIAIMDFEARSGVQPGEAQTIGDMFSSLLQQTGRFTVVDRKKITTLMQEQGFQASQEGDAAKAGKVLAVRKMFFGSIGKLGKDVFVVNIKMSDVETSSIEYAVSKYYDDDLEDIHKDFLPGLISEIVQTIDGKKK